MINSVYLIPARTLMTQIQWSPIDKNKELLCQIIKNINFKIMLTLNKPLIQKM